MCTNISFPIRTKDNPVVSARTMDFVKHVKTSAIVEPRNQAFPKDNLPGQIHWFNRYGFVGMMCTLPESNVSNYVDGINEEGLSAAALWLDCSSYPKPAVGSTILYQSNLVCYILGNCKDIKEVEIALYGITVVDVSEAVPSAKAPLHFIFSDASGNHLIAEFINGLMKIHVNKIGVMTNDPSFDWHLTNLCNYENLRLENNPKLIVGGEYYGSGQLGSPGDPTSPSRFVRSDLLRRSTFIPQSTQQSIGMAQQILETIAVPCGTSILVGTDNEFDYTQWSIIRDHTDPSIYFYTAFNSRLYGIHLNKLDLNDSERKSIDIIQPIWYVDVTNRLEKI